MALNIYAVEYISLSELQTADPSITYEFTQSNPKEFESILYNLGVDTRYPVEIQENTHRNRFGNVYTGYRWVGNSRIDKEWVESGSASPEAIDKSKSNKMLIDLYRAKGLVEVE